SPAPTRMVPPNFRTPRLLGIVNFLISSQILVCGLGMASYLAVLPLVAEVTQSIVDEAGRAEDKKKEAALAGLDAEIKAAKTDVEKAVLAERRKAVESRPRMMMPTMDFSAMGLTDRRVIAWSWAEVISGIVVNVLMLVSGVGLMSWKKWAWTMGVWTGWLKILRLLVLYGIFIAVVSPVMSQGMAKMATDMIAQQQAALGGGGGAPPPTQMLTQIYSVMNAAIGVMMIVGGAIYPAILLWLLHRPPVKSACSGAFLPPKEPKEPRLP
ncbi:MAG: hypothetical protein K2X91_16150, partial [Thermoleophilia bacterium]|nr:hypothetical protein [Thermoleophilia bacterium]